MLNYLKRHGGVPLSEAPLNDVDRLIFAQLAYVNWAGARRDMTLFEAAEAVSFESAAASDVRFGFQRRDDRALVQAAGCAARYEQIRFADFADVYDGEREQQFAALSLRMGETLLIAFRGTDNTLSGWKEDFNMAFLSELPAQALARDYVSRMAAESEKIELFGHSKGGNLALYAAATCGEAVQNKVACAVSFDGPGLSAQTMALPGCGRMQGKMRLVMPRASLVGLLFEQPDDVRLVESRVFSLLQHYPYTWKTEGMNFVYARGYTSAARVMSAAVRGMLAQMPLDMREQFIEAVYEIVSETQAETLNDLLSGWLANGIRVARKLLRTDRETYRLVFKVLSLLWRSAAEAMKPAGGSDSAR